MTKHNPPNQSLDNRLMQRIKDLPRPDERYAKWEIRAELDDIHQLIQDEVIRELESLMKSGDILPYSQKQDKYHLGAARVVNIINDRISALREDKE